MNNLLFNIGETPLRYTLSWMYTDSDDVHDIKTICNNDVKKVILLTLDFFDHHVNVTIPYEETFLPLGATFGKDGYSIIFQKSLQEIINHPKYKFCVSNQTLAKYCKEFLKIEQNFINECQEIYLKHKLNELS